MASCAAAVSDLKSMPLLRKGQHGHEERKLRKVECLLAASLSEGLRTHVPLHYKVPSIS